MSKQTINLGTTPNGAGGDTPRSAFTKVQANIDELYAALGAPASGALPAALPIIDGGTASTTVAGARTNLGLKNAALADIVGTMASGAIIETGSNANGYWTRYQDGTQICWRQYTAVIPMGVASTGIYRGDVSGLNSPAPFVGVWTGTIGGVDSQTAGWGSIYPTGASSYIMYFFSNAASHASTLISIMMIGRWK